MFKTKLCEILNIKYPILQGGMAWIADASLAAGVSNAGGLGLIAAGNAPADIVRDEIKKAKELTDKPFGVNIMLLSPFVDEVVQVVREEKVKVVTTGAGNPGKYIKAFKDNGIKVIPVVPSIAFAKRMERNGADAIIAEGTEAGGHIGDITTMCLIPQIVDAVDIPVIAAGGIGDGRGVAAVFMLGAQGIQVGTRFLVAKECTVHQKYKERVIKSKDTDSEVTGRFTGHPVRVLKNKLTKTMLKLERENNITIEEFEEKGTGALRKAAKDGDINEGSVMAGQIAGLIKKEQTCEEIITEMFDEAETTVKSFIK